MKPTVSGFLALLFAAPAYGAGFNFGLPVDCVLGETCFIQNYFDHNPADGAAHDYSCGSLTYDAHNGTDFRVPTYADLEAGIAILATANGEVININTQPVIYEKDIPLIKVIKFGMQTPCGSSIRISHGTGWESTYCHLDPEGNTVKLGDKVKAGDVIGKMGTSGNSMFPHLHYELRHHGNPIDPFVGFAGSFDCASDRRYNQWSDAASSAMPYVAAGVVKGAFSADRPSADVARAGGHDVAHLSANAPELHFWSELYGLRQYDRIRIEIHDPDGVVLGHKQVDYDEPFSLSYESLTIPRGEQVAWKKGRYTARVTLTRFEKIIPKRMVDQDWVLEVE